jgi:hypothetical protein
MRLRRLVHDDDDDDDDDLPQVQQSEAVKKALEERDWCQARLDEAKKVGP